MPCRVEILEPDSFWYCCNCGDGPMVAAVSSACTSCNDHERCGSNVYMPTPPDSPRCTKITSRKCRKRARDPHISKPTICQVSVSHDGQRENNKDDPPINDLRPYEDASDTLLRKGLVSLLPVIDQHTNAVIKSRQSLYEDLASTATITTCPSGSQNPSRAATKSSLQRSSRQNPGKAARSRDKKSFSGQNINEDSDDDDIPSVPPNGRLEPNRDGQPNAGLACPFCKFDPHRYRHEQSCKQGWATASDLRGHLTRGENPHKLSDCFKCLRVFSSDRERDEHESAGGCEWKALTYPAEGVSSRLLRSTDARENIPKLTSGRKLSPEEEAEWYRIVYRMIHGEHASIPDNIYHDADENVRRSNDPDLQGEFRSLLRQTLQRQLPERILLKAVRCHLLSTLESETRRLLDFLDPKERTTPAIDVLSQSWDVQKSRRSSGDSERAVNPRRRRPASGSGTQAQEQPMNPVNKAISTPPRVFNELVALPSVDEPHVDRAQHRVDGVNANDISASLLIEEYTANPGTYHQHDKSDYMYFSNLTMSSSIAAGLNASTSAFEPDVFPYSSDPSTVLLTTQALHSTGSRQDLPPPKRPRIFREDEQRAYAADRHVYALDQPETSSEYLGTDATYTQEDHLDPDWLPHRTLPGSSDAPKIAPRFPPNALFGGCASSSHDHGADSWTADEVGEMFNEHEIEEWT